MSRIRQTVDVEVFGQKLTVASDDGPEHVRAVARFVDETMRAMVADGRAVVTVDVALLTALNIASEYQKLKLRHEELAATIERLSRRLGNESPD